MTSPPDLTVPLGERTARLFEVQPVRYETPLDLARAMDPDTKSSPALNAINQAVTELMADDSPYNALIVSMPAQEGKSTLCARRLPEWVLDREPDAQVAIVSYQDEMAIRWGREIKWDAAVAPPDTFRVHIRRDSSAAGRWDTQEGGGVYCTGVGGPLTGRSVGRLLVIDDPVKDRAAAESATIRQSTWDWWESVALTRFGSRTRVVLIMTRFHEDDLAGRILSRPSPLKWRQLRIPAVAETDDEIGRAPGEELASVRGREPGYFLNRRATMSPYVFAGMYQQTPTAPEGNFFRRASFRYWRPMPAWNDGRQRIDCEGTPVTLDDCWRFATVDVAASTRTSADFTVIAVWAVTPEGFLVLLDRARARVEMHDHFALLPPLAATWRFDQAYVEKVFYSSTFVKDAQAAGYAIAEVIADTDKVTRAIPAAGRIHAGRVWFPAEAPWLDEWCDELAIFPQGAHDDQVDTFSYAARVLVNEWTPGRTTGITRTAVTPFERSVAAAHHSATGDGKTDLDIMNVPF